MSDAPERLASEPWGDRSQYDKDAERERLVVNWLRVGIVALYALQLLGDVAINGWTVPQSTDLRVSDWWIISLCIASILIWAAAIGAVDGRRRFAVWQGHTSGMVLWILLLGPRLVATATVPLAGAISATVALASIIVGAMWGARRLGTFADSLVPSAWLEVDDARGWQMVAWAAWPFVTLLIGSLVP